MGTYRKMSAGRAEAVQSAVLEDGFPGMGGMSFAPPIPEPEVSIGVGRNSAQDPRKIGPGSRAGGRTPGPPPAEYDDRLSSINPDL